MNYRSVTSKQINEVIAQIIALRQVASALELGSVSYFLDMALAEARMQNHRLSEKQQAGDVGGQPGKGSSSNPR